MFKFIHAADIHMDSPLHKLDLYEGAPVERFRRATRRAFENLVRLAITERVAFVLIAGDLYDGDWKDYNTVLYMVAQMNTLRDAGIRVFIVAGNHDAASRISKSLRFPDNVCLFPSDKAASCQIEDLQVAIHGQSFASPAVKKNLARGYPGAVNGWYNIGLLHTCVSGREGHEPYAPCTLADLKDSGYDYWALGHVHQHEVLAREPLVVFSGNTQGRHARETGAKGCMLVTVGDDERTGCEFVPLDVVRWVRITVAAAGAVDGYDIVERARSRLAAVLAENGAMPLAARVRIQGETPAHSEMLSDPERWVNEIRAAALDVGNGRVWVEKVKVETGPPAAVERLGQTEGAIGELLALMDELDETAGARQELAAELADLEKKLPRELTRGSGGMRCGDAEWMRAILLQVRPMLVSRLLRKGAMHADR